MKLLFLILLSPACSFGQFYDNAMDSTFKYKEIGDTIFVNKRHFVPGDTLYLGRGSAPDKSFVAIYEQINPQKLTINRNLKYLPRDQNNGYLIFAGRQQIKNLNYKMYEPLFYSPRIKKKWYIVNFVHAISTREIIGF